MKPNHKGRIIRDPRGSGVGGAGGGGGVNLLAIGRDENNRLFPHAPPPLVRNRIQSVDHSSGKDATFVTQKKIHELEIENSKLNYRLQEAELSIVSYKGLLSAKSTLSHQHISTQTDVQGENGDMEEEEEKRVTMRDKMNQLITELNHARTENATLRSQVALLIENESKMVEEYETKTKALESLMKVSRPKKSSFKKLPSREPATRVGNQRAMIVNELNDFNGFLCQNLELIRLRLSSIECSPKRKSSVSDLNSPLKIVPIDHACGPMTPKITDRGHDVPTPSLGRGNDTGGGSVCWVESPVKQSASSTTTTSTNTDQVPVLDEQHQHLEIQIHDQKLLVESLSERLSSSSKSLQSVVTKFGNEINAIKHWSHCKELVRVASLRELGLEKDRLLNELKYAK
jgi:hypothetical protein